MINAQDISILIVDDDPDLLESITSLFAIFGFKVDDAPGGVPAWEKIQNNNYDIVITDVKMPDMNGLELLKKIRAKDAFQPKVLLISGHTEYQTEDILELGANGFFSKPFNATAVRDSLSQTLLAPSEKWKSPVKQFGTARIDKKFKSFNLARGEHAFNMGQAGLFIGLETDIPAVQDPVDFSIEFQDAQPFAKLEGSGHVVWSRYKGDNEFSPGVGIKIDYLDEFSLKQFIDWVQTNKPTCTVPKS